MAAEVQQQQNFFHEANKTQYLCNTFVIKIAGQRKLKTIEVFEFVVYRSVEFTYPSINHF